MDKFARASDEDFELLQISCKEQCMVFKDRRLPDTCSSQHTRIGFETSDGRTYSLLVDRGTTYQGNNQRLQTLFREGKLNFVSFAALKDFFRNDVHSEFPVTGANVVRARNELAVVPHSPPPRQVNISNITDFDEIERQLNEGKNKAKIDAQLLVEALKEHVVGQDMAMAALASTAANHANRIKPSRPGSIYMLGTTGVGKTKAAISLADCLRAQGVDYSFLRLDMTMYQEEFRVSQLIGSPQGYAGHGDGSELINHLGDHARSIVLLDEIEKAHPAVFKTMMNVFDAGQISSSKAGNGKYKIDCKESIFIMTSNLEADKLISSMKENETTQGIDAMCRQHLLDAEVPKELIGRITKCCAFKPLSGQGRAQIVAMAFQKVANEFGVSIEHIHPDVIVRIISESGSNYGARADEQTIDRVFGEEFSNARQNGIHSLRIMHYPS